MARDFTGIAERWFTRGWGGELALAHDIFSEGVKTNGMLVGVAGEEVFGPVITIVEARGEEEALRLANDTEYGLSSTVHTADAERGAQFALRLRAGMTHVNDSPVNEEDNTAYGGVKRHRPPESR